MRFTFLAPFRTDLNFNSVSMAANPGALEPTLEHVFKWYANNSTPGISLQSHRKASRSGQLYYSGLAEDALPSTVKPVFELILSDEWVADCVEGKGFNSGLLPSSIERCRIEYFDNTVALLHVDVCFSGLNDAADLFDSLDQWSTEFCGFLIEHVYPAEKRIVRELVDYDRRSRRGFSLRPSEFNVFLTENVITA
ncbi:hypothetical protein HML84_07765 [Alcanivorax sp. IO_7]|nr:hypothetical protein HML84_07765 [Alcanivorax sp. IO_7]